MSLASLLVMNTYAGPGTDGAASSATQHPHANTQQSGARVIAPNAHAIPLSPHVVQSQRKSPDHATKDVGKLIDEHLITLEKEIYNLSKELEDSKQEKNANDNDRAYGYYLRQHQVIPSSSNSHLPLSHAPVIEPKYPYSSATNSSTKSVTSPSEPLSSEILNQGAVTTPSYQQGSLISVPNTDQGKVPASHSLTSKMPLSVHKNNKIASADFLQASYHHRNETLLNKNWLVLLFTASGIMVILTLGVYYRQRQIDGIHKGSSEISIKKENEI